MRRIIIVAIAKNYVIGRSNGDMAWNVPEDFKFFKETTINYPVLMGRKTYGYFKKPLKDREHIVITRDENFDPKFPEVKVFHNLEDGFRYVSTIPKEKMFIIGGGDVYRQVLEQDLVDEMIISWMDFEAEGEVIFPKFDETKWKVISRDKREQFEIVHYVKVGSK